MSDTVQITFEINRDVFAALRQEPDRFVPELRLAAAIKWYELGIVSQSKAAEIAGISRSEFLTALFRYEVTPFQEDADDILHEVNEE